MTPPNAIKKLFFTESVALGETAVRFIASTPASRSRTSLPWIGKGW